MPDNRHAQTTHRVSQYTQRSVIIKNTHTQTAEYHQKHIRSSVLIKFSFSSLSLYFSAMVLHSKLSWQPVRFSVLANHLLLYHITSTHKHATSAATTSRMQKDGKQRSSGLNERSCLQLCMKWTAARLNAAVKKISL